VWAVAAVAVVALGRWLRRRWALSTGEAAAGAVVLLWAGAYAALLTLGPIGFYRPLVLRVLLAAVVIAALVGTPRAAGRHGEPRPRRSTAGAWLAALAALLMIGPLLLLQLASPVSPFMDVLPYVASVQKIVTFRFYDPFGNDAAGFWAATRQVAGCDGLFSFVALVAGVSGGLAITTLIVPLATLQIVAIYLVGRAVVGGLAGGFAALFLLETFVWRRTPDGRGTALAFMLVAIGIAFLLARRRSGVRTALGGVALGTAVAVNPLIGACGMQVAAIAAVLAWMDLALPIVAPGLALGGGSVLALPQVAVGLGARTSPYALMLALPVAAALLWVAGRLDDATLARRARATPRAWPFARVATCAALLVFSLYAHAYRRTSFYGDDWYGYGVLVLLGAFGVVVAAAEVWRRPERLPAVAVPAVAVWIAMINYDLADLRRFPGNSLEMRSLASEVTTKMTYYWTPYWAAVAAGIFFAVVARRWMRGPTIAMALALAIYPLRQAPELLDFDTAQLTVSETWAFNLANAARGYFAGYPDRHWVLDDHWRDVDRVLDAEIAAGRLRYDTHVLLFAPPDTVMPSLGTGVSTDLITPAYDPNSIWSVGSRVRGPASAAQAFAQRPRYVLLHDTRPEQYPQLADYDAIFTSPRTRLYRLRAAPAAESSTGAPAAPTPVSDATM
jgi:hypothetical protein